jgi:hypothetical protein
LRGKPEATPLFLRFEAQTSPCIGYQAPNPNLAFGINQPRQQGPIHGTAGYFQIQPSHFSARELPTRGCQHRA